ncbi:DUF6680 family protein [Pelosinus sp. IPA-1]|uniref:DUF6680 family protein n=1 Tax=Pelosinus sp. IPA-1 TaxID=3029569 RepID=UPI0024361633|nr:DUF6680 family protein [Pelosinus sp. IPA-1]GMA99995.1 hypothetical protein PIPA1_27950 [Pelosinus sp. IPA-1]
MELINVLTLSAMLLSPLIALQVSRRLQKSAEKKQRKEDIFRTLMKTRASILNPEHVEALNLIDVIFYGTDKKDRAVMESWKVYLDHLNNNKMQIELWIEKREELLIELLENMALSLNYDFGKSHIKRTSYFPQGYANLDSELQSIRIGLIELLNSERALSVMAVIPQEQSKSDHVTTLKKETA